MPVGLIDRPDAHTHLCGDFPQSETLGADGCDFPHIQDFSGATQGLALRAGISQSGLDSFHDQRSLQLCDGAKYCEDEFSGRRAGVELLREGNELDALRAEGLQR